MQSMVMLWNDWLFFFSFCFWKQNTAMWCNDWLWHTYMQFESAFYWAKISLTIVIVFQQSLKVCRECKIKNGCGGRLDETPALCKLTLSKVLCLPTTSVPTYKLHSAAQPRMNTGISWNHHVSSRRNELLSFSQTASSLPCLYVGIISQGGRVWSTANTVLFCAQCNQKS